MKSAKLCVLVLLCAAALAPSAQAQWAVFDASNLAEAVKELSLIHI